jgi:hypothetical protein
VSNKIIENLFLKPHTNVSFFHTFSIDFHLFWFLLRQTISKAIRRGRFCYMKRMGENISFFCQRSSTHLTAIFNFYVEVCQTFLNDTYLQRWRCLDNRNKLWNGWAAELSSNDLTITLQTTASLNNLHYTTQNYNSNDLRPSFNNTVRCDKSCLIMRLKLFNKLPRTTFSASSS